jgi:hypothetical protein
MPEPFLNLGDVGIMRESIRCSRCDRRAHRMHAQTVVLYVQVCCLPISTLARGFASTGSTHNHDSMQTEQGSGNILNGWRKRYHNGI